LTNFRPRIDPKEGASRIELKPRWAKKGGFAVRGTQPVEELISENEKWYDGSGKQSS